MKAMPGGKCPPIPIGAMKPGPRTVRAAVPQTRQAAPVLNSDPTSDKFELFVLPEWVEEDSATQRTK